MWVMNQDEDICIECSYLGVYDNQIVAGAGDKNGLTVGEYKSEERAKRVLLDLSFAIATDKKIFYMPKECSN